MDHAVAHEIPGPGENADPHHHPRLAHHFDSMATQHDSAKLGTWLFLVTEMLMFSGLFLAYAFFRSRYPDLFHQASRLLSLPLGGLNTIVLIFSSLTMVLAVREAQQGHNKACFNWLLVTNLCALTFMVVKAFEYSAKFTHGIGWGVYYAPHFDPMGPEAVLGEPQTMIFFSLYFMMTGLHGFHVLIGMFLIGWMMLKAARGQFDPQYNVPVENVGLYWHIVDLIWIFLFPLLYLIDRS